MLLKLILIIVLLYLFYQFLGNEKESRKKEEDDENTLLECSRCHIYITKKEAFYKKGKIYCDECAKEEK